MARPVLSEFTFLRHLFSPAKNPLPTGLRKRRLKGVKGRSGRRLAAFNRMSAASQHILDRADLREEYLRGEVSLADARRRLRDVAVSLGIAKPSHTAAPPPVVRRPLTRREELNLQIERHLKYALADAGKRFNAQGIHDRVPRIPEYIAPYVQTWGYPDIREAAGYGSPFEVIEDNVKFNPFWYN